MIQVKNNSLRVKNTLDIPLVNTLKETSHDLQVKTQPCIHNKTRPSDENSFTTFVLGKAHAANPQPFSLIAIWVFVPIDGMVFLRDHRH